jgi:DNA-binding transcriptional MocR family regulator
MLEATPLYHRVADQIHALVRAGTLRAGDRVPSVRRLSLQQGVSVSTVLQAYQRLEAIGVIEARPQSGFYVKRAPVAVEEPAVSRPPRRALTVDVNDLADAVLSYAADPSFVAFGSGCPAPEFFPLERVRRAMSSLALRDRDALGRYGLLVTTTGCMEAINLCLRAVTRPGDLVALESPTYYGFLQILQTLGLRALEIPTHPRTGISLEALELALAEHPVKAVLVMPNVSNPIGASMSDPAKKRLVELLAAKNVPLIEDHIYADLSFDNGSPRAAKAFDRAGGVMLCGSLSKTLSPGLKAGYIEPGRWRDRVRTLKWVSTGGTNELVELALAEVLESGAFERSLRPLRRRFESHVDAARGVIAESFPRGTRVTRPSGAFILWLELPKGCDSVALFERLIERRITIAPGPMFSASGRYRNCIRLSLGQPWSTRQERALREIGKLAREFADKEAVEG